MAAHDERQVARRVEKEGDEREGQEDEGELARTKQSLAAQDEEHEAEEGHGPEARPPRGHRETQGQAQEDHGPDRQPFGQAGSEQAPCGRALEEHREDVRHGDAALHEVDAVGEEHEGGEKGGALGGESPAGQEEEDRTEKRSRQRGSEAPGPALVIEGIDPGGDEQLGQGRVHPFHRLLSREVLAGALGVIDLVEVLVLREAEAGQAKGRGQEEEKQGQDEVAFRSRLRQAKGQL